MKKGKFSKYIIVGIILLNIIFTAAVLYVFYKTGNEPSGLVVSWFAFTTGELSLNAYVKKSKLKEGNKANDMD